MKESWQNLKEGWKKMSKKTRNLIMGILGVTVVAALIAILALGIGGKSDYSVLFSGLNQEEAQQIGTLLQDKAIDYKYNASDGTIRVPESVVETTRVELLLQGYPKNGFAYDMYLDNTGLMTTESDKKQITLYELQDRLGATIRSFEGVREARVNIAEASERRYVLEDNESQGASASVVITMMDGSSLTEDKAQAVKNLVAHSVRGMNFTEVVVLDGATMLEVGGNGGSTGTDMVSLTSMLESSIAANVRNVLEKLYGVGKTHEYFESLPMEKQPEQMGKMSSECMNELLAYSCEHMDEFYLILKCSAGTKYASMIDDMVEIEVEATHKYYKVLEQLGTPAPKIDERLEHIMATGMIGAFFEMVLHRMPFDDAKAFLQQLNDFYTAGWMKIMGQ